MVKLSGAIATSGTYERGAHSSIPGRAAGTRAASASVTGPDLGQADALATALAVAGPGELSMIERLDGYEALVASVDGIWRWTSRLPNRRGRNPLTS